MAIRRNSLYGALMAIRRRNIRMTQQTAKAKDWQKKRMKDAHSNAVHIKETLA